MLRVLESCINSAYFIDTAKKASRNMISSQAASVVKEDRHSQIKWPVHHLDEICRWSVTLCVHFNIMILKNFYLFKIIFLQFYMKINQEKYKTRLHLFRLTNILRNSGKKKHSKWKNSMCCGLLRIYPTSYLS